MSKYTMYYYTKQAQYKRLANTWFKLSATMNLTPEQCKGMSLFFKAIARRFGLTQAFKDIGVL